jgi:hypothetical protein
MELNLLEFGGGDFIFLLIGIIELINKEPFIYVFFYTFTLS